MSAGGGVGRLAGFATTAAETKELQLVIGLVVKRESRFSLVAVPATARADAPRAAASSQGATYELKWVKNVHLREPTGPAWREAVQFTAIELPNIDEILKTVEQNAETDYEEARSTESDQGPAWAPRLTSAGPNRSSEPGGNLETAMLMEVAKSLQREMQEQRAMLNELKGDKLVKRASASSASQGAKAKEAATLGLGSKGLKLLEEMKLDKELWDGMPSEERDADDSEEDDELAEDDLEELMKAAAADSKSAGVASGDAGSAVNASTLIQLQMLKLLSKMDKKDADGSDDEASDTNKDGASKGFAGIQRLRREVKKKPLKVVKRYREHVKQKLGVRHPSQHWEYRDYSRLLLGTFGKMKGLWRCHHLLSDVLQLLDAQENEAAMGLTVQALKALHQVALDGGAWETALLLLPDDDPLSKPAFGGEERELEAAYTYKKSLQELRAKQTSRWVAPGEDAGAGAVDDEERETDAKVKPKAKAKGKSQ